MTRSDCKRSNRQRHMRSSVTTEDLFELWWAEYMPDATRDRAWAAYSAALPREGEEDSVSRAATTASSEDEGKGRAPTGWQIESGSGWISIRNLESQCGQDFYKDRDPLIYGFLLALAAAAPSSAPGARELLEAFPGCGDMRGMESWCGQVRTFLRTGAAQAPAVGDDGDDDDETDRQLEEAWSENEALKEELTELRAASPVRRQDVEMAAALMDEAANLLEAAGPEALEKLPAYRWPLADELSGAAGILRDYLGGEAHPPVQGSQS